MNHWNKKRFWANAQYSRCECLEVVGIPSLFGDTALEDKLYQVNHEFGVEVGERDMQSCR